MISITTTTVQENMPIILKNYQLLSKIKKGSARISKNKLLDGTVSVIHSGFVEGDRTLNIKCQLSKDDSETLWETFKTETFLNIGLQEGLFNGAIKTLEVDNGKVVLTIEIVSKLSI